MKIKNETEYLNWKNNNTDPYGTAIFSYAEAWADLMEKEMESGKKIPDIAKETSHEADTDSITGYMYGAAVAILSQCWEHGDVLRMWHNGEYNYHGDGVVNPAVINISVNDKEEN